MELFDFWLHETRFRSCMVDNIVRKCNTSNTSDNSTKYKEENKFLSKGRSADEHGEKKYNPPRHDAKNGGNS